MAQGLWTEENKKEKKVKKDRRIDEIQRKDVLRGLMSTIGGRSWVLDLLYATGVFEDTFSANGLSMAYNTGQRLVGLRILKEINDHFPEQYSLMMRERNERSTNGSNRTGPSGATAPSEHPGGADTGGSDQDDSDPSDAIDPNAPDPYGYYKGRG